MRRYPQTHSCYSFGQTAHLTLADEGVDGQEIANYLTQKGHLNPDITRISAGIEDCFMELVKKTA